MKYGYIISAALLMGNLSIGNGAMAACDGLEGQEAAECHCKNKKGVAREVCIKNYISKHKKADKPKPEKRQAIKGGGSIVTERAKKLGHGQSGQYGEGKQEY